jgi:hypothetical protein
MTTQTKDILIYNKEELQMSTEPLETYLQAAKLPHELVAINSNCWKGYTSKWAIDNKKLFLIEWQGYILDYQEVGMNYLFPGEEIVFAKWFTGQIKIGLGDLVRFKNGGYSTVNEGQIFLVFENGLLVEESKKWLTQEAIDKMQKKDDALPF